MPFSQPWSVQETVDVLKNLDKLLPPLNLFISFRNNISTDTFNKSSCTILKYRNKSQEFDIFHIITRAQTNNWSFYVFFDTRLQDAVNKSVFFLTLLVVLMQSGYSDCIKQCFIRTDIGYNWNKKCLLAVHPVFSIVKWIMSCGCEGKELGKEFCSARLFLISVHIAQNIQHNKQCPHSKVASFYMKRLTLVLSNVA